MTDFPPSTNREGVCLFLRAERLSALFAMLVEIVDNPRCFLRAGGNPLSFPDACHCKILSFAGFRVQLVQVLLVELLEEGPYC